MRRDGGPPCLVVPNSVVAKSEIVNLSQPTPLHGQSVDVDAVIFDLPGNDA